MPSMVVSGSPKRWDRWHIIPQLAAYTTYIPLIYCLLGGYMLPTIFLGEPETTIDTTWKGSMAIATPISLGKHHGPVSTHPPKLGASPSTFTTVYLKFCYPSFHNHASVKNGWVSNRIVTFQISPFSTEPW